MYLPSHFEEKDKKRIIAFGNEYGFATLVTTENGVPFANHLPVLIEHEGTIRVIGHMAKANEQWRHFQYDREVLVIFQGPHAYISPSNYKRPGVPTWNYAAIHMYGSCSVIENQDAIIKIIENLTYKHEKCSDTPWIPDYPVKMLDAIIGFEIAVNRIEGKFKLSQNRSQADRVKIIGTLNKSSSEGAKGVAKLMTDTQKKTF